MFKSLFVLMDLCLLTMMAYLGVSIFYKSAAWNLVGTVSYKAPITAALNQPAASDPSFTHYLTIIKRNLFKTVTGDHKKAEQINIEQLNQTALELKLWGTVTSDKGPAFAVIQRNDLKSQELYKEGDAIAGAVIKMILKEQVVLRVGINDEILEMEKRPSGGKTTGKTPNYAPTDENRLDTGSSADQEIVISRNQIDDTVKNVHELMTQAQINPHFKEGHTGAAGLVVSAIKPDSIFRKMGLRDQDVIVGIEGKIIESLDDALGLYEHLKNSDQLNLQVERRGRMVEIHYAIE
ncbi:MAG: type II secretion system protein GspC [Desulfobacterales bacterium]